MLLYETDSDSGLATKIRPPPAEDGGQAPAMAAVSGGGGGGGEGKHDLGPDGLGWAAYICLRSSGLLGIFQQHEGIWGFGPRHGGGGRILPEVVGPSLWLDRRISQSGI
jgi:hypothetical protein